MRRGHFQVYLYSYTVNFLFFYAALFVRWCLSHQFG